MEGGVFQTISRMLNNEKKENGIVMTLILGDEPEKYELFKSINKYYGESKNNEVGCVFLPRNEMETYKNMNKEQLENLDISNVPFESISASFVRKVVKLGLKEQFHNIYMNYLEYSKREELYDLLTNALNSQTTSKTMNTKGTKRKLSKVSINNKTKKRTVTKT